ncbi:hypothetical protein [Polaribacter porphyrae]|uniref:N-acetyltransferase domain-containing protein n=1 Tax=Polaribacter porphyrae TaxID=1137780 RepID=A0A2S7WJQ3_9FLAO|nr:hypothetical protein [Polaribacter porphyrae]PQJ77824.1 hypothetical protein BTO18_00880 [Polaribacter porphyrae]
MIQLLEVHTKKELKQFIMLPYTIHKNHKEWLPPLISDEWKIFDKTKNHSFEHCNTILYLAKKNNAIVGRIMGIINHIYNKGSNEKNVRFFGLECYDDAEVYDKLITAVEAWGKEKQMDKIIGPLGFSDKDPQGFLIEGFKEQITVMVTNHSYEYMISHTERNGYQKKLDIFQYTAKIPEKTAEIYTRIAERATRNGYKVKEFKKSNQVKPYINDVFQLINKTYKDIYGFAPLDDKEAKEFSERFLPLLKPQYIKLVLDASNTIVAFVVAMPDISEGFKKTKGRLFPFGFLHILKAFKKTNQLNLLLGCVDENIRNSGLVALLNIALLDAARSNNLTVLDSHLILEENTKMRAIIERMEHTIYKKYRIFEKSLD